MPRLSTVPTKLSSTEPRSLPGAMGWLSDMLAIGVIVGLIALLVSLIA